MRTCLVLATLAFGLPVLVAGCRQQVTPPSSENHERLEWVAKGIAHEEFTIALGYRGRWPNPDRKLEPVAAITRDGKPVADAMVFSRLVATDGSENTSDEKATVYEPSSGPDVALYSPGKLHVPSGTSACVVRFRIILPDVEQEWTREIEIPDK